MEEANHITVMCRYVLLLDSNAALQNFNLQTGSTRGGRLIVVRVMVVRTLGSVRASIARVCGQTGVPADSSTVVDYINEATEELMNAGDWPGVVDRYHFKIEDGEVIVPSQFDRLMGFSVGTAVFQTRSPWFEFVDYGPGPNAAFSGFGCGDNGILLDRGEAPVFVQIPDDGTNYTLFTIGEVDERVDEVRPQMNVQGVADNSGMQSREVRTEVDGEWISGEQLEINGDTDPFRYDGTAVFTHVTQVVKPVTRGYVELWATNGANSVLLATYAPNETIPTYRKYYIPARHTAGVNTVLVRARKRFVPVANDNDQLIIANLPALKAMVQALSLRDNNDWAAYAQTRMVAVQIMREEAKAYRGTARTPVINFSRGYPLGSMPNLR